MKLCKDCRYFVKSKDECRYISPTDKPDLVYGGQKQAVEVGDAYQERSEAGSCGPHALRFAPVASLVSQAGHGYEVLTVSAGSPKPPKWVGGL